MATKRTEEVQASNGQAQDQPAAQTIRWDDSEITNSYANVCNVNVVQQYEARFGAMNVGAVRAAE